MKKAGFGAIFCNIGDYLPSDWDVVRERAKAAGVVCGPWLRTNSTEPPEFDPAKLEYLIEIADSWEWAPLIVNSEKEIDHTDDDITGFIAQEVGDRDAAISSEVRPYQSVDWRPLAKYVALPQNFPAESGMLDTDDMIRENWQRAGFSCVVITYGTYHGMKPTDFLRLDPYGIYTGNDTGGNYEAWGSLGICDPCGAKGIDMEKIGSQHGISAMADIFRKQWPDKTGKKDPDDPSTWKAIDKWERAMLILVQDHDESA
jgi:hypothetical protein